MTFFSTSKIITDLGENTLNSLWPKFPELKVNQIAITLVVYPESIINNTKIYGEGFSYRGKEKIYPASIVKLFYLVALEEWLKEGKINITSELNRAVIDMVKDSSNDATSLVVDTLTNTTSGPQLPPEEFTIWQEKRNAINRYFQSFNWAEFASININQKTWCDGPYGRERDSLGLEYHNRNMLTTSAIARLIEGIISGKLVSVSACERMRNLMNRSNVEKELKPQEEENQINGFLGEILPDNAQIWSKAGWTSQVRHDSAYIEIPNCQPYLLVVFTEGKHNSQNRQILPFISQEILRGIKSF